MNAREGIFFLPVGGLKKFCEDKKIQTHPFNGLLIFCAGHFARFLKFDPITFIDNVRFMNTRHISSGIYHWALRKNQIKNPHGKISTTAQLLLGESTFVIRHLLMSYHLFLAHILMRTLLVTRIMWFGLEARRMNRWPDSIGCMEAGLFVVRNMKAGDELKAI